MTALQIIWLDVLGRGDTFAARGHESLDLGSDLAPSYEDENQDVASVAPRAHPASELGQGDRGKCRGSRRRAQADDSFPRRRSQEGGRELRKARAARLI